KAATIALLGLSGITGLHVQAALPSFDQTGYLGVYKQSPYYTMQRGSAYVLQQNDKKALPYFEYSAEHLPTSVLAEYNLGYSHLSLAANAKTQAEAKYHLAKAEWSFLRTQNLNPDLDISYFKLGKIALAREDYQGAVDYYRMGVDNRPDNA